VTCLNPKKIYLVINLVANGVQVLFIKTNNTTGCWNQRDTNKTVFIIVVLAEIVP